ncbi:MAG: AAA family ATPase [Eggerthellaceae bacterium]|jgi:predicted AAA+ superfamily ATPase
MYLRRKIDEQLRTWKADDRRKPLIVKGPRQVGKTESIRRFARQNYAHVVEVNFVEEPRYKAIIADGYSADSIVRNLSMINPQFSFEPGQTLLFFDELQDFPEIATALKFFAIDGRYDVICSGSMLGVNYRKIESNSVGYKSDAVMRSLDFEEFLWATGRDELPRSMLAHMIEQKPFSEVEMQVLQKLFLDYTILGGMPEVVRSFIETGTFSGSLERQRQLALDYEEDVRKYAQGIDQARILNVFRHIPVQLAKENKKFQISKVAKGARFREYRGCVEWLQDAGMVNVCHCLSTCGLPLKGNYDEDKYKIYFADSGLLLAQFDDEVQEDVRANRNLDVCKGALAENSVAEALVKSGYPLFYYRSADSQVEEDFLVRTANCLVAVEVKAKNGRAKSLRRLIESDAYPDVRFGIKLAGANIGEDRAVYAFPRFCSFLLRRWMQQMGPELEQRWM